MLNDRDIKIIRELIKQELVRIDPGFSSNVHSVVEKTDARHAELLGVLGKCVVKNEN